MLPLDFFAPLDRQLLSAFCEASALRQQAAAIIAAEGVVIGTGASRIVHPAMRHVATSASMASLAGKLHLSHSSRLARDVADTQAKRPWDRPGKWSRLAVPVALNLHPLPTRPVVLDTGRWWRGIGQDTALLRVMEKPMSLPPTVVCWITPGVRAQLQAFADSQGIPAEQCTGEAITAYLRAEGAPPADPVPAEIAVAQIRPPLPLVLEALRMSESNPD